VGNTWFNGAVPLNKELRAALLALKGRSQWRRDCANRITSRFRRAASRCGFTGCTRCTGSQAPRSPGRKGAGPREP
jgi:hypothetical protein